jgi:hypothetical protein
MNRIIPILSIIFIGALASSCASHKYTVLQPPSKELTDYQTLEISDFTTTLGDDESKELAARFADKLYENVMAHREEEPDKVIFDKVVRQTDETKGVAVLDGMVVSYEKGSRAKRYWIGFGAGKAYCTIRSTFTDKSTGEKILVMDFDGELAGGLFGGTADETVQAVVEAYLDYFDDYYETQYGKQK